jgi:ribonuclease VapC
MVLDTSAIIAAVTNEPDSTRYRKAILEADTRLISSIAVLETRIVLLSRLGSTALRLFDELLEQAAIVVVPFDGEMAKLAFDAFRQFGKGQGHSAQLNIVDCAVYALAKFRAEPLLFKGDDFARTDISSALA